MKLEHDLLALKTLRAVSCAMITKANSGHPGICLGAAPILHVLYTRFLSVDPKHPDFLNRDRFILSAGHGSALLYTLNHLAGYDLTLDDLKQFRQANSKTPGHPEYCLEKGIEITTGPLGQGVSSAVGFSIAECYLNAKTNSLINYRTFVLVGDGDLEEGVTLEALSLAGHLGLKNLIILFDSNGVQLDGNTTDTTSLKIKDLVTSLKLEYHFVADGDDLDLIEEGIKTALNSNFNGPKFIEIKTVIGKYSKYAGTATIHGKALSKADLTDLYRNLAYEDEPFTITEEVYDLYAKTIQTRGALAYKDFDKKLDVASVEVKDFITCFLKKEFNYPEITFSDSAISTRVALGQILAEYSKVNPFLIGGSADLSSSTMVKGADGNFTSTQIGRNLMYGVREHAMAAITNGLTLSGFNAFSGGFLVFSDYMRPAIRLAALMNLNSVFIFSHDSVLVGEDGPTHQPLEHLASFRLMPNLTVIRPACPKEMNYALEFAFNNQKGPVLIASTRQAVPHLENVTRSGVFAGAYTIYETSAYFTHLIIASGSEVSLAIETAKNLAVEGIQTRVVSMPSLDLFLKQDQAYQDSVLPKGKTIVAIELGVPDSYYRFTPYVYGLTNFAKSMPASEMFKDLKFTVSDLVSYIKGI